MPLNADGVDMPKWKAVEDTEYGKQILLALTLALRGTPIPEIAEQTGLPESSLYDIRKHGAFSHRKCERKTQGPVCGDVMDSFEKSVATNRDLLQRMAKSQIFPARVGQPPPAVRRPSRIGPQPHERRHNERSAR